VLSPGNLGQRFARASLDLPLKQIVQMSNFVGFALDSVCDTLREAGVTLPLLWVVGHPGKLAKIIDGAWDTHSHRSACAVSALMTIALSKHPSIVPELLNANSCELVIERLAQHPDAPAFWTAVEDAIANILVARLERVDAVRVRLFSMSGTPLGENR
jgi:cobalt-precorrin-5B (C1)-methyltransferase